MTRRYGVALLVISILVTLAGAAVLAQGFGGPRGGAGGTGPGMVGPGGQGGPGMRGGGSAAISADGGAVYVLSGPKLLKLDGNTLQLVAETDLPRPERGQRPGAGEE
ncbi:MAG: hypothetical protein GF320_08305 [Armatimonadia bacterium]|nr:hypothetical protein [Armatimonadia bacterium]